MSPAATRTFTLATAQNHAGETEPSSTQGQKVRRQKLSETCKASCEGQRRRRQAPRVGSKALATRATSSGETSADAEADASADAEPESKASECR